MTIKVTTSVKPTPSLAPFRPSPQQVSCVFNSGLAVTAEDPKQLHPDFIEGRTNGQDTQGPIIMAQLNLEFSDSKAQVIN